MGLSRVGLSPLLEACYRALIDDPTISVPQLGAALGITEREVADVVQALLAHGLLGDSATTPTGVTVRRPGLVLSELAAKHAREVVRQLEEIAEAQAEILALDTLVSEHTPSPVARGNGMVEVLEGLPAVQAALDELAYRSRRSVDTVTPGVLPPRGLPPRGSGLIRSVHRGLRVRWVVQPVALADLDGARAIADLVRAGGHVRVTTASVHRQILVDDEVALIPIDVTDADAGALLVRQQTLLAAVQESFDLLWARSAPVAVEGARLVSPGPMALADSDREVLTALAALSSDEAAARSLAISVRQLRRRAAHALAGLGARNRFHAGVLAERYGILHEQRERPGESRTSAS